MDDIEHFFQAATDEHDSAEVVPVAVDVAPAVQDGGAVPEAPAVFMPLRDFCAEASGLKYTVEVLGAFEHIELRAGRVFDAFDNYLARLKALGAVPAA